jgi:signal peptide peptidase SppA
MNYPRIFERVYLQPLCIAPQRFASIHAFLLPRLKGTAPLEIHAAAGPARPARSPYSAKRAQRAAPTVHPMTGEILDDRFYVQAKPGVAVVPIYGALAKNLSAWEEECGGGTDLNAIQHAFNQAIAHDEIHTIILDIDSPGGEVTGIPELASAIAAAPKPVLAFTDASMASAAYWLGAAASAIVATPSARLGSIGVYMAWLDERVRMELEGITLQFFAAGKHKGIGLPGRELTAEDRALLQAGVDATYAEFTGFVRARRGEVADETMQGQMFTGPEAQARHLVNTTVQSFDELLASL